MFVPTKIATSEIDVKKSRFIAIAIPFNDINNLKDEVMKLKEQYPDAKHYLYAYHLNQLMKGNDDGEPGHIARGFLNLIKQHNLNLILVVVVRYFGGIKLGASNLTRTYLAVVNDLLKKVEKGKLEEVYQYHLTVDYPTFSKLKNAGYFIENVQYFVKIELDIISKRDISEELKKFSLLKIKQTKVKRITDEHGS
ncbi:MAG: YigZ family protein [Bacilli bacterium]|nr:YigZ family protein [Bacilli bacterium]